MDFTHVNRLKEEQQKGLHLCEEKITHWEKFKVDYETLKQRLETLPDALSYDITVPFGTQAFAKGKIVHTNEVMVLLGDNWFAEVSARQAANITERRIKQCVEMLADLQKEKEQLHNWNKYIEEVSANEDLVEIVEKYDEEQEKQWREQHSQNVREHRQRLARERINSGGSTCSEEDLLHRLDSLEESGARSGESEGSFYECSDEGGEEKVPSKLRLDCNRTNDGEERSEVGEDRTSSPENAKPDRWDGDCSSSPENGKHVRWQDLSKQNVKKITFRHTKNHVKNRHQHNIPVEEEDPRPKLQSPSDIYRQFGAFLHSSPPKSILKVKHSPSSESDEPFRFDQPLHEEDDSPQKESSVLLTTSALFPSPTPQAFTGEVRETSSPIHITQKKPRPASHFKNSRRRK